MTLLKNHIGFRDNHELDVKIYGSDDHFIASGMLFFGSGQLLRIKISENEHVQESTDINILVCKIENKVFTLFGCDLRVGGMTQIIHAKAMIDRQCRKDQFTKFSIISDSISKWMCNSKAGQIRDNEVIKQIGKDQFEIKIEDFKIRKVMISSSNTTSVKHKQNKTEIEESCVITVETQEDVFTYQDIILYINSISSLFSILIGHSVSIDYVLDKSEKRSSSIYFNNNSVEDNNFKNHHECFAHSSFLFRKQKWSIIFQNVFGCKHNVFNSIWNFYSGMMTYDGFWDYEILGHMSILDQYVQKQSQSYKKQLSNSDIKIIKNDLHGALAQSVEKLSKADDDVINAISMSIEGLSRSSVSTFSEKYYAVKNNSNSDVTNAIAFDDEYFKHMKDLRDDIAHGSKRRIKNKGDITHEMNGLAKIKLLLMYWCFRDMGFNDEEYLQILDRASLNNVVMGARLNQSVIHKALETHNFIHLDDDEFEKVKSKKFWNIVLEYDQNKKAYKFHEDASEAVKNVTKKHKFGQIAISEAVDDQKIKTIDYVGNVYVENQDQIKSLHLSYILNGAEHDIVGFSKDNRFINDNGCWKSLTKSS